MADNTNANSGSGNNSGQQGQEENKYFKWLKKINASLSGLNDWLDAIFDDMANYGQAEVDAICEYVGKVVSYHVNCWKADALNALHEQYLGQLLIIQQLKPIIELVNGEVITDPTKLFEALVEIFKPYLKPYETAINFMKELIPELEEFADNIQKIASYQPTINVPDINFDKFKLDITIPTLDQVIAGNVPYPDPPGPFVPPKPSYKKLKEKKAEEAKKAKEQEKANEIKNKLSGLSNMDGLA